MIHLYTNGLTVALSLVAYNSLFTGLFIFFRRRDATGIQYFISNLFIFGWALGFSLMASRSIDLFQAEVWGRFAHACFLFVPVTWLHFVLSYTGQIRRHLRDLLLVYGVSLFLIFASPTRLFILSFTEIAGIRYYPVPGPAFKTLSIIFLIVLIYAFWVLYSFWREETSVLKKEDARFFFYTQLYGYGLSALSLLPAYGFDIPQYQLLILPLWQFLLAYAMVRHQLLDYEGLARTMHRDRLAAMSTVTASMHHELKNPLTAIKTFTEFLPKKYADPAFRAKFVEIVTKEIARVNDLLQQLLEFSRPSEPVLDPVDANEIIDETLKFIWHSFEVNRIKVKTNFCKDSLVLADRNQLKQVILNIILNCVQAMPDGGHLTATTELNKKGQLVIEIKDTGIGISKEDLKKIGDPYFTTKEKGTGLGLSIVQHILDKHNAELEIESQPQQGTTIRILMKRAAKNGSVGGL